MNHEQVILVDEADREKGSMDKLEAHEKGVLHRAFSIFIFNEKGEMLLQQRSLDKYHSGGLWSNACCSHPRPGESTASAASRRLKEELGFDTPLKKVFDFIYHVELDQGLTEHEFDHVYAGEYSGTAPFNTEEVQAVQFAEMKEIHHSLKMDPDRFTAWFRLAFPGIETWWNENYKDRRT